MVLTVLDNDLSYTICSIALLLLEVLFVLFVRFKQPGSRPDYKYINKAFELSFYLFIPTGFYLFITFFNIMPLIKEFANHLYVFSFILLGISLLVGILFGLILYLIFWIKNRTKIDLEEKTNQGYYSYLRTEKHKHINTFSLTSLVISINICITIGCFILSLFAITGYYH